MRRVLDRDNRRPGRDRIGDEVTYTITATNVGTKDFTSATPAVVLDDLTGVLDDATFDGDVTVGGSSVAAQYTAPQIAWTGPLAAQDSVTLTYTVTLTGEGDGQVDNITWQPPSNTDCAPGSCTPPDPASCVDGVNGETNLPCATLHEPLPRPQISKASPDLASAQIGQTVHYTVTFTNAGPGDYTATRPAQFADDLSGVLDDASFDGNVTVDGSSVDATYDAPQIIWSGSLAAGESVTLNYAVTLTGDGDLSVANLAYVPPAPPACAGADCSPPDTPVPPDPDSCVDGANTETGLPCAALSAPLPKLAITKSSDASGVVHNGDTVSYTVTGKNVGPGDYTADDPATVIDDLTGVLDDAEYDNNAAADAPGTLSYAAPQLSWVGALASGDSVSITYTVTVTGNGDLDMLNVAFTPPSTDSDCVGDGSCPVPTTCVDGADAETGQPCAVVDVPLPALYITKAVDKSHATAGDTVTFTVTMTNTGNVDFTQDQPAVLTDDLSGVLDDATYANNAAADMDGELAYQDEILTWTGPLQVGETVTVTYSVTVNPTASGDDEMDNIATIPGGITPHYPDGQCPDGSTTCDPAPSQATTATPIDRTAAPLAVTGTNSLGLLTFAGLLLLLGATVLLFERRRRTTTR